MSQPHDNEFAGFDPHETLSTTEYQHFHVHLTPMKPMTIVFALLLALTALTVWTSNMHGVQVGNTWIEFSGFIHIMIAMGIAVVKALLVAAYFMHLKYDKPMNTIVVSATLFAVVLFIGLTMLDLGSRYLVDPIQGGEIKKGGNYQLYGGSHDDPASPLSRKPEMNPVEFAKSEADAKSHADPAHGEDTTNATSEDAPTDQHGREPAPH